MASSGKGHHYSPLNEDVQDNGDNHHQNGVSLLINEAYDDPYDLAAKESVTNRAAAQYPNVPRESAGKLDIALMIFINFLSFVCFAIVLPSLWPFLKSFGKDQSWVGWAVAANSGGTFVASPILGKWADWRGVKEALFVSLVVMIGGNVMYAMSQNEWMLLVSRFIVGCAAANYAPASAYLTYATDPKDRTTVMIVNSAASILGFILGPALATALAYLPSLSLWKIDGNEVTYPGWASVALAFLCLIFIPTVKNIRARKDVTAQPTECSVEKEASLIHPHLNPSEEEHLQALDPDFDSIHRQRSQIMYHIQEEENGAEQGEVRMDSFSVYSPVDAHLLTPATEGDPFYSVVYSAKGAKDINFFSQPNVAKGATSMARPASGTIRSLNKLRQPGLPVWTISVILYLQFAFYNAFTVFETIGTPYTQNAYDWSVTTNGFLFAGIGGGCIISLVFLQLGTRFLGDHILLLITEILMITGFALLINYPFNEYVELARFLVAVGCASVGFSSACALVISIFSKVLENVEQGVMMGWLSASGSLARVAGPLSAAYLLQYVGGGLVFLVTTAMLALALILTVLFFSQLKTQHIEKAGSEIEKASLLINGDTDESWDE